MIAFLRGNVAAVTEKTLLLDVNNVGYLVGICARDAVRMPSVGDEATVYTYLSVREDDVSLFGFLDEDDLAVYKLLIGVSGIGPKAALGILGTLSADDVRIAVLSDDANAIAKAPGIGAKTARKLILELKDKIDAQELTGRMLQNDASASSSPAFDTAREEAAEILVALGYSRSEAMKAIRNASLTEDMDADQILGAALQEHG